MSDSSAVSNWRAYRTAVRTRRGITTGPNGALQTAAVSAAAAASTPSLTPSVISRPSPTTTTSAPSPPSNHHHHHQHQQHQQHNNTSSSNNNNNNNNNNQDAEHWHSKYISLQQQTQQTQQTQQNTSQQKHAAREQVQRELALARQKSAVLSEQVQALEISATELSVLTKERDSLASNLSLAMSRVHELEATNQDLQHANARLSEGLDAAMASAQEERDLLRRRQERERAAIEEAEQNAANAGHIAATAQDKIDACLRQTEDAVRARTDLESELAAIKEQLVMERHVASSKVQEFASKLQVALTSRDENTHTYQLALHESQERTKELNAEVQILRNIPTETQKLKRKLRKTQKRLKSYERQVRTDTENLRRQTHLGLASVTAGTGIPISGDGVSMGIEGSNRLQLHSFAGKELMVAHTLSHVKGSTGSRR